MPDRPTRLPVDRLAEDEAARLCALAPQSFIVEAPAGAGKTELLTQRFLALLATVESPEEVIAITFTRKAAAEMRGRIVRNLHAAADGVRPESQHKALTFDLAQAALAHGRRLGWDLLQQPARLRVTTIDSLCQMLARQAPLVSQIGGSARIADDPVEIYEDAARRTVAMLESTDREAAACVADALRHLDNDVGLLQGLLASMLARRDQWLPHGRSPDIANENRAAMRVLVETGLAEALEAIAADAQSRLLPIVAQAAAQAPGALSGLADWATPVGANWEDLATWKALAGWLLTQKGSFRKRWTANEGFPPGKPGQAAKAMIDEWIAGLPPGAEEALASAAAMPGTDESEAELPLIEALARLLWIAAAQLWVVFSERREVDFIAVAEGAVRALGDAEDPSELALDYRVRHLLVDEFQDTSPSQIALLTRLTAAWSKEDRRTLFCVGDPMQSIYRFRKADVGLFIDAAQRGIGEIALESLRLARNNRSDAKLIDWINGALPIAFADSDAPVDGAIAYRPFVATQPDRPGSGAIWHPLICEAGVSTDAAALGEAERIVTLIEVERADDPEREIAVLVRARSHLEALVAYLRRHRPSLAFEAVEIDSLESRQWVRDIVILARALLQLADRVHWLALLRSPLCGLTLSDLHALAAGTAATPLWTLMQDPSRVAALSADGQGRLLRVRQRIGATLAHAGRQSLAAWIEGCWLALAGPATVPDAAGLVDCRAAFDRIAELAEAGRFSIDTLSAEFEKLFAAPDPSAAGRLSLMTIHKAKGLEFDTVILPGLHRAVGGSRPDRPLLRWEPVRDHAGRQHTAIAALPERHSEEGGAAYKLLERIEAKRARSEAARVLYVGATRAKRALHLFGCVWRDAAGEAVKAPPADSLLSFLWPLLIDQCAARSVDLEAGHAAAEDDRLAAFVPPLRRLSDAGLGSGLESGRRGESPGTSVVEWLSKAQAEQEEAVRIDAPGSWQRDRHHREALIGTLAHRYLERIARDGIASWSVDRIENLQPAMDHWLRQEGFPTSEAKAAAGEVAAMLATTVASTDGQRVLSVHGEAELALVSDDGSGARLHVVDRSFVEDGVRWVIDYKTDRVAGDGPQHFIEAATAHRAQLGRYAALFEADAMPVRTAVFFVRYGRLVEVS